jgi:High potential iron-sulfur protein
MAADTPMSEKKAKAEVQYTPHAEKHSERCALCRFFLGTYGRCQRVAGQVSPAGWCELFEREGRG